MKKKIIYGILAVILIVDVIITLVSGLKVSMYYGEGEIITFNQENTVDIKDVKNIAKEVLGKNYFVQNVEFFSDSASIKVKELNDEQINKLVEKINEKYSSELTTDDLKFEHVSNIKIRTLVEPYIIPVIIATLLILVFYAIRFKGTRQMIDLLKGLIIGEGILYTFHAIFRLPVNTLTLPFALILYTLITLIYTTKQELKKESYN